MKAKIRTFDDVLKKNDPKELVEYILAGFKQLEKDLKEEKRNKKGALNAN